MKCDVSHTPCCQSPTRFLLTLSPDLCATHARRLAYSAIIGEKLRLNQCGFDTIAGYCGHGCICVGVKETCSSTTCLIDHGDSSSIPYYYHWAQFRSMQLTRLRVTSGLRTRKEPPKGTVRGNVQVTMRIECRVTAAGASFHSRV